MDFDQKRLDELEKEEDYEAQKADFYATLGKRQKVGSGGKPDATKYTELSARLDRQERERLQWEREALENMDRELDDMEDLRKRHHVRQSYDHKLSKAEKEKLQEVLTEVKADKEEIIDIKKRREEANRLRQEKIRKLKGETRD